MFSFNFQTMSDTLNDCLNTTLPAATVIYTDFTLPAKSQLTG